MEASASQKEDSTMTEFTVELSSSELEVADLNKTTFVSPGNDLVFSVKNKGNGYSFVLESCKTVERISKVTVTMFTCENKESISKTILPRDLQKLPLEIMELEKEKMKIEIKIDSKNENDVPLKKLEELVEKISDVTLIVGDERFSAQKSVLSSKSSVFAAMFDSVKLEQQSGEVEIKDIRASTFKLLLEFVYTNKISGDVKKAKINWPRLTLAADKFMIKDLKKFCLQKLAENLDSENAIDVLIVADRIKDGELKKICSDYIVQNKSKFFHSKKYKDLQKNNFVLAMELFEKLMSDYTDDDIPYRLAFYIKSLN